MADIGTRLAQQTFGKIQGFMFGAVVLVRGENVAVLIANVYSMLRQWILPCGSRAKARLSLGPVYSYCLRPTNSGDARHSSLSILCTRR
jgi:hypothetical protein